MKTSGNAPHAAMTSAASLARTWALASVPPPETGLMMTVMDRTASSAGLKIGRQVAGPRLTQREPERLIGEQIHELDGVGADARHLEPRGHRVAFAGEK